MQRKTRSLLEELNDFAVNKDRESIIESRAIHIIDSAVICDTKIPVPFMQRQIIW